MKREDNKLMESLSTACFGEGKKYHWRKLTKAGVVVVQDNGKGQQELRRVPLTVEQAKDFMLKKIKARQERAQAEKEKIDVKRDDI